MVVRAEAAAETRRRILNAANQVAYERIDLDSVTLDEVAKRAGVTTMTVVRHFGGKNRLLEDLQRAERRRVMASRQVAPGDITEATRVLYDHYEQLGDWGIRAQARELVEPNLRHYLNRARMGHRKWVLETFAPQLKRLHAAKRRMVVDALIVATDVLTWKVLYRDMGRPRPKAEATVQLMIEAIVRRAG